MLASLNWFSGLGLNVDGSGSVQQHHLVMRMRTEQNQEAVK